MLEENQIILLHNTSNNTNILQYQFCFILITNKERFAQPEQPGAQPEVACRAPLVVAWTWLITKGDRVSAPKVCKIAVSAVHMGRKMCPWKLNFNNFKTESEEDICKLNLLLWNWIPIDLKLKIILYYIIELIISGTVLDTQSINCHNPFSIFKFGLLTRTSSVSLKGSNRVLNQVKTSSCSVSDWLIPSRCLLAANISLWS